MLHSSLYAEVSAKEDINIEFVFQEHIQFVYDLQKEKLKELHRNGKINMNQILGNHNLVKTRDIRDSKSCAK